jgi:hypothetical protein
MNRRIESPLAGRRTNNTEIYDAWDYIGRNETDNPRIEIIASSATQNKSTVIEGKKRGVKSI